MEQSIYNKTLTYIGWVLVVILLLTVIAHAISMAFYMLLLGGALSTIGYFLLRRTNVSKSTKNAQCD